jgi:ParB-like chromosome segregation protein Spo0J
MKQDIATLPSTQSTTWMAQRIEM